MHDPAWTFEEIASKGCAHDVLTLNNYQTKKLGRNRFLGDSRHQAFSVPLCEFPSFFCGWNPLKTTFIDNRFHFRRVWRWENPIGRTAVVRRHSLRGILVNYVDVGSDNPQSISTITDFKASSPVPLLRTCRIVCFPVLKICIPDDGRPPATGHQPHRLNLRTSSSIPNPAEYMIAVYHAC